MYDMHLFRLNFSNSSGAHHEKPLTAACCPVPRPHTLINRNRNKIVE